MEGPERKHRTFASRKEAIMYGSADKDSALAQKEDFEKMELFRGTLGFDIIFYRDRDGMKRGMCVEFNGHDSDLQDVQDLPEGSIDEMHRQVVKLRAFRNPKFFQKEEIIRRMDSGEIPVTPERRREFAQHVKEWKQKVRRFPHAFRNPPFIAEITNDKTKQGQFIPSDYAPHEYKDSESRESSTGYWICKPKGGGEGRGIMILSNEEFQQEFADTKKAEKYTIQEFIVPCGADNAPPGMENNAASVRYHLDFVFLKDGEILPIVETGFGAISKLPNDPSALLNRDNREKTFVVNTSAGSQLIAPSKAEFDIARPIAEQIIRNLAAAYESSPEKDSNK